METTTINKLKPNEYFKIVNKNGKLSREVYYIDCYDTQLHKYWLNKFSDISFSKAVKPTTIVTTDFIF